MNGLEAQTATQGSVINCDSVALASKKPWGPQ